MIKKILIFLSCTLAYANHPFTHDLNLTSIPGKIDKVMITAHGMNGKHKISSSVKTGHIPQRLRVDLLRRAADRSCNHEGSGEERASSLFDGHEG